MWAIRQIAVQIFALLFVAGAVVQKECAVRNVEGENTVSCVCNSTYCDTLPVLEIADSGMYHKITTNKEGLRFKIETESFVEGTGSGSKIIEIDVDETFQEIFGFGGAFTDSTGIVIKDLDEAAQENLLNCYFSKDGIEYSVGRVPIGGSDFSTKGYSYDDGGPDGSLNNFKLAPEDFDYKIPYVKKAIEISGGNIKLFASAWTAPKWMKTNGEYTGFIGFIKDEYMQTWADYFVKFLDSYNEQGINFWGITTGNEPSLNLVPFMKINTVGWTTTGMTNFITKNLGPAIRNSKHNDTKIIALDDQRVFLPWIELILLNDKVRDFVDGIGVHWYLNNLAPPSQLTTVHNKFPEKFLLATEACTKLENGTKTAALGNWDKGERYAKDIIDNLSNWVTGWMDWNMALNPEGGPTYIENFVDAPIIVNKTSGEFYKTPSFYVMGHFSKFIPRGSLRVKSSGSDGDVAVVAFKRPDQTKALVILNSKDEIVSTDVLDLSTKRTINLSLSPKSITTLLYQ